VFLLLTVFIPFAKLWKVIIKHCVDDDDGLYFKTMSIKAAKACGVVYNNWSLSKLTKSRYRKNVELELAVLADINISIS